jgi:Trk K+ transport system NAD-binding subunit
MNIIIVGAGEIGRHLAQELWKSLALSVIEVDSKVAGELEQTIDANVVRGDGN